MLMFRRVVDVLLSGCPRRRRADRRSAWPSGLSHNIRLPLQGLGNNSEPNSLGVASSRYESQSSRFLARMRFRRPH